MRGSLQTGPRRVPGFALIACSALLLAASAFWARSLLRSPSNTDEIIYLTLARALVHGDPYALRGTPVLAALPAEMYDHPIFNHPPGFPAVVALLAQVGIGPVFVSYFAALACVAAVGVAAWSLLVAARETAGPPLAKALWILVVLLCAADPLLALCARRVWMDAPLAAWVAWAVAAALLYLRDGKIGWIAVSSAALAGALATKLIAGVFLIPVLVLIALRAPSGRKLAFCALAAIPAFAVVVWWEFVFWRATGSVWPTWLRIDPEIASANPFVAERIAEGPAYFAIRWATFAPAALPVFLAGLWAAFARRDRAARFLLGGIAIYLAGLIALGISGVSKEARYLSPLAPICAMLAAAALGRVRGRAASAAAAVSLAILVVASARIADFYLAHPKLDEPLPLGFGPKHRG